MDIRSELQNLPAPDPAGVDRVWDRYRESRTRRPGLARWMAPLGGLALAAAAAVLLVRLTGSEEVRTLAVDTAHAPASEHWSEVVDLDLTGVGQVSGTSRDLEITWESGTLTAHVTPNSGTNLAVVTEEARVEVVGTVFSVTRDPLGVTTSVERGKVKVTCADGWEGYVTPEDGPRTCLPVRAALLLARADALTDAGAAHETVLETLDRGVDRVGSMEVVLGELLVRRMHLHGEEGRVDAALADARAYRGLAEAPRRVEVDRYAGWVAMGTRGCDAALPFLEDLEPVGNDSDRVLLAECVMQSDPERAVELLRAAIAGTLDEGFTERAQTDLARLESR